MSAADRLRAFEADRGLEGAADALAAGLVPTSPAEQRLALLAEFRRRRAEAAADAAGDADALAPGPAPGPNWIPLGPAGSLNGQTSTRAVVSGRVPGLAVSADGRRVYAASANGGVWSSGDAGRSWRPRSDLFDVDPTGTEGVDSLACGAIALVDGGAADHDRLYVGTGEPFGNIDAYLGVGPLMSPDGGGSWHRETASPSLVGSGFYEIVVDPADPDHAVAATRSGLYRRTGAGGAARWDRQSIPGGDAVRVTSVVRHRQGSTTTFFAAIQGGGVITASTTGSAHSGWSVLAGNTGFPTADVGRISLAVSAGETAALYALVAKLSDGKLLDVFRIDVGAARWTRVDKVPTDLFGNGGQGWYDQAIAVDPTDRDVFYVGGAGSGSGAYIHRCHVATTGAGATLAYTAAPTAIGLSAHPDVHALVIDPADHRRVWTGCDGGVFVAPNALEATGPAFEARNSGLSTMTLQGLAHHPTLAGYVFCGAQDNGGLRYGTDEVWDHHQAGDGGATVVNWATPRRVLNGYIRGDLRVFDSDGPRYAGTNVTVPPAGESAEFYPPIVGVPPSGTPAQATRVAWGGRRVYVSDNFGTSGWTAIPTAGSDQFPAGVHAKSMVFTSYTRLFVGTTDGHLWEYAFSAGAWTRTDHGRPRGESGPITGICPDPAVAGDTGVYVTVGGVDTLPTSPVWRFDATTPNPPGWAAASGAGATALLGSHHNAVLADPANPNTVWAAADIGVWRSTDRGASWQPFSNNLPDAAVLELDLHPTAPRVLRASTHGRGVFEIPADGAAQPAVELTIRTNRMDTGRGTAPTAPAVDPLATSLTLEVDQSPDIVTDPPNASGRLVADPATVDPVVITRDLAPIRRWILANPAAAPADAVTKVHVRVRNRGPVVADGVQVMLLVGRVPGARTALPAGYAAQVAAGNPVNSADWHTVGVRTVDGVGNGRPGIATFDLRSSLLPPAPGSVGQRLPLLALVHHAQDPFDAATTDVDTLAGADRRAALVTATVAAAAGAAASGTAEGPPAAATLAPVVGELAPRPSRLTPAATALLAHKRLGDVVDALTHKVNSTRVQPVTSGFARTTLSRRAEHQVLALATRAKAAFEGGPKVPARAGSVAAGTSTFALLGASAIDVTANVGLLEPGGPWIAETIRRGTGDRHRSLVDVRVAELALSARALARAESPTPADQAKIDAFCVGLLSATAAGVLANPLLADLLARDTNLDWGPDVGSAGAHAVDTLIATRLFGSPSTADLARWWPAVGEVPDALWTGLRKALATDLGLPDRRRKGFAEFEDGFDPGRALTDVRLRNAYALWRGDLSSGQMPWTGWWGWISLFTLASPLGLLVCKGLPHGRAVFEPGVDFDERAAFEVLLSSMGTGSIGPFVTAMALWSAIDEHTDPFAEALVFFLLRVVLTSVGLGTSGDDGQEALVRWLGVFTPMAGIDVYALIRSLAAGGDPPGDRYVFAMQTAPSVSGLLSLAVGAAMNGIADESGEEGLAWLTWAVYTLGMFLGAGIPFAHLFAGGAGWRQWFLRDAPRRSLVDGFAGAGTGFVEPVALARTFDDSGLWADPQLSPPADPDLPHLAYPSGMRALVRIWKPEGDLEIRHDADTITFQVAGVASPPVVLPPTGVTTAELVAALDATGIANLQVEAFGPGDPDPRLPAPQTVNDPGDRGLRRDHDAVAGVFVRVGADKEHAYVLRHAPRAELSTRQSLRGVTASNRDASPVVPMASLGDVETSGLGAAADLAVLLSLGAAPTLAGGTASVPAADWPARFGASGQTIREVSQVFRRWNLGERRTNEWSLLVTGGARSEKAGDPAAADPLMRPYGSGRTSPAGPGAEWVEAMGWLPLWRTWLRVAADPGSDSEASVAMPFTPPVRLASGERRPLTNRELTEGVRFLLDLEA